MIDVSVINTDLVQYGTCIYAKTIYQIQTLIKLNKIKLQTKNIMHNIELCHKYMEAHFCQCDEKKPNHVSHYNGKSQDNDIVCQNNELYRTINRPDFKTRSCS